MTAELALDVLFWLDLGQSPRDVARWLHTQLDGSHKTTFSLEPLASQLPRAASTLNGSRGEELPAQSPDGTDHDAVVAATNKRTRLGRLFGRINSKG
jgi:hypothetical protein